MKIENYTFPKSSFLSLEKDAEIIITKFLKNDRLKKLLYYPNKECLSMKNLTQEESYSLLNGYIKLVPKIPVDSNIRSYITIAFDRFLKNYKNPEYRDNIISFDILCHFDQWNLGDFKLRPFKIAGEIDSMLNQQHLTGIGTLDFLSCNYLILNDEFGGLSLAYTVIHGQEDKN